MIEGQPQRVHAHLRRRDHFSGLVIEGQPQPDATVGQTQGDFSGLVIEGQPQQSGSAGPDAADFSALVIGAHAIDANLFASIALNLPNATQYLSDADTKTLFD